MGSIEPTNVNIHDIRQDKTKGSLLNLVNQALSPSDDSSPSLPTLLLYNEKGLRIFEDITYLDEYYLTNAEIETLKKHAARIAAYIPAGSRLIELGSGNLRKIDILLQAFETAHKSISYYALDLSLSELKRTFSEIDTNKYHYVRLNGLHGTYDDALVWLGETSQNSQSTCIMTLGSSIGNFHRDEAAAFLQGYKDCLRPSDWILVGLDACQDEQRVFAAYNDAKGTTEQFYRNGLDNANDVFGCEVFKQEQWGVEGRYDSVNHRHQASYIALTDVETSMFKFQKGQRILLEYAYKYSRDQSDQLWHRSGLISQMTFGNRADDYHLHLLSPSTIDFPGNPSLYASQPMPSLKDWEGLWAAWDTVTKSMVPHDELMNKPIKLRNSLIFYLGHIPTFADIHFTKATGAEPTQPAYYYSIFERGIDPDVDNPELCHDHSEIPEEWPPLEEILKYTADVRSRILNSIHSGTAVSDRKLCRGLWLAYEHEAMHLETFLYMLLQSSRVLPPPGQPIPNFEALSNDARQKREENAWHEIPASELSIGLDDAENNLPPDRYFGWDNERPRRSVRVPKFLTQSRCISNEDYAQFLEATKRTTCPASWTTMNGSATKSRNEESSDFDSSGLLRDKAVRTVYGPIPLELALDWPIMASYDELAAYAEWAKGRIPTFEEARSIYQYVETQKKAQAPQVQSSLISAVNGHLCNNGVEETPPPNDDIPTAADDDKNPTTLNPSDLFIDLTGRNVGFKRWHPSPITDDGNRLRGQCETGGLWEWTSSPLNKFEGFKAMDLYPGYTADFFDGKHNIILGGSWATAPRIAGRKSFVNWYQRNYPYTWATARLVRDVE